MPSLLEQINRQRPAVSVYSPGRLLPGTAVNARPAPRPIPISAVSGVRSRSPLGSLQAQQEIAGQSSPWANLAAHVEQQHAKREAAKAAEPDVPFWKQGLGIVFGNPVVSTVLKPLEKLQIPQRLVTLGIEELDKALGLETAKSAADTRSNWEKVTDTSQPYGTGQLFDTGSKWLDDLLGFTGDVATDPFTYVSGGTTRLADTGLTVARAGVATELAENAYQAEKVARAAATAGKEGKTFDLTRLMEQGAAADERATQLEQQLAAMDRRLAAGEPGKVRVNVEPGRKTRAALIGELAYTHPELSRELGLGEDLMRAGQRGFGAASPALREALGVENKLRFAQHEIPLSGKLGRGMARIAGAGRVGLNKVPGRNILSRGAQGTEEAWKRAILGKGTMDPLLAGTALGAREVFKEGREVGARATMLLRQLSKDIKEGGGEKYSQQLLREAETLPEPNKINDYFAKIAKIYEAVTGSPLSDEFLRNPDTYVPHMLTREFKDFLKKHNKEGKVIAFRQKAGFATDDLLEGSGYLEKSRKLAPDFKGIPKSFDVAGKELQLVDGTIEELNTQLGQLFPEFEGKFYLDDPTKIGHAYATSLSRAAGTAKAIERLAKSPNPYAIHVTGAIADALEERNRLLAQQNPVLDLIRAGHEPGAKAAKIGTAPKIPEELFGVNLADYFTSTENVAGTHQMLTDIIKGGKAYKETVAAEQEQNLVNLSGLRDRLTAGLKGKAAEATAALDEYDKVLAHHAYALSDLGPLTSRNLDAIVATLASVKLRRSEIEQKLAEETQKVVSEAAKVARPRLEKTLEFARQIEQQADQILTEGPTQIRAEAEKRLEGLLEPVRRAETTLQQETAAARRRVPRIVVPKAVENATDTLRRGLVPSEAFNAQVKAYTDATGLPLPEPGMVRLYRGAAIPAEPVPGAPGMPDWVRQQPEILARNEVQGRWFTHMRDLAESYPTNRDPDEGNILQYVDVPRAEYDKIAGLADQPEHIRALSVAPHAEVVLPPELMTGVKEVPRRNPSAEIVDAAQEAVAEAPGPKPVRPLTESEQQFIAEQRARTAEAAKPKRARKPKPLEPVVSTWEEQKRAKGTFWTGSDGSEVWEQRNDVDRIIGYRAFDRDKRSLGLFPTRDEATAAVDANINARRNAPIPGPPPGEVIKLPRQKPRTKAQIAAEEKRNAAFAAAEAEKAQKAAAEKAAAEAERAAKPPPRPAPANPQMVDPRAFTGEAALPPQLRSPYHDALAERQTLINQLKNPDLSDAERAALQKKLDAADKSFTTGKWKKYRQAHDVLINEMKHRQAVEADPKVLEARRKLEVQKRITDSRAEAVVYVKPPDLEGPGLLGTRVTTPDLGFQAGMTRDVVPIEVPRGGESFGGPAPLPANVTAREASGAALRQRLNEIIGDLERLRNMPERADLSEEMNTRISRQIIELEKEQRQVYMDLLRTGGAGTGKEAPEQAALHYFAKSGIDALSEADRTEFYKLQGDFDELRLRLENDLDETGQPVKPLSLLEQRELLGRAARIRFRQKEMLGIVKKEDRFNLLLAPERAKKYPPPGLKDFYGDPRLVQAYIDTFTPTMPNPYKEVARERVAGMAERAAPAGAETISPAGAEYISKASEAVEQMRPEIVPSVPATEREAIDKLQSLALDFPNSPVARQAREQLGQARGQITSAEELLSGQNLEAKITRDLDPTEHAVLGPLAEQNRMITEVQEALASKPALLRERTKIEAEAKTMINPRSPGKKVEKAQIVDSIRQVARNNPEMLDKSLTATEAMLNNANKTYERIEGLRANVKEIEKAMEATKRKTGSGGLPDMLLTTVGGDWSMLYEATGAKAAALQRGDTLVANELHRMFTNLFEIREDPAGFSRAFRTGTDLFKTYATLSPGFHVRNGMSAAFMNTADGVPFKTQIEGFSLWRKYVKGGDEWLLSQARENPDVFQAFQAAFGSGAGGRYTEAGFVGGERTSNVQRLLSNPATRFSQRAGERVEGSVRLGMALDSIRRGDSMTASVGRISRVHFDYADISKMDATMKQLIPFWTFLSRNLPLQISEMWLKPRSYLTYQHFVNNMASQNEQFTPQYWLDAEAWNTGMKVPDVPGMGGAQGLPVYLQPDFGFNRVGVDVADLQNALAGDPLQLLSNFNPLFTAPAEFITKKNFYTGQNYDNTSYSEQSGLLGAPIRWLANLVPNQTNEAGQVADAFSNLITSLNPVADRGGRLFPQLVGGGTSDKQRQVEAIGRFLGAPIRTLTPKQQDSEFWRQFYELQDRQKALQAMAKEAASNAG